MSLPEINVTNPGGVSAADEWAGPRPGLRGGIYGTPENMLPAGSSTYTYDALGRLGTYQEGPVTESYGYGCDKIGLNQKTLI